MPLATNPKAIFTVVLESDKAMPVETQPRFYYRYLTGLQQIELANLLDAKVVDKNISKTETLEIMFKAAAIGLTGWAGIFDDKGNPIPFDKNNLKMILSINEAAELAHKVFYYRPDSEDKKKLDSPSDSDTAESAKTVKV